MFSTPSMMNNPFCSCYQIILLVYNVRMYNKIELTQLFGRCTPNSILTTHLKCQFYIAPVLAGGGSVRQLHGTFTVCYGSSVRMH